MLHSYGRERTISRLMPKKDNKPSQTWMTFLHNHTGQLVSIDFFTVPTIRLRAVYVDGIYGEHFRLRVEGLGIEAIRTAPKSPWQNCYVERVIGSIRRECLNHVIVLNDRHLRRVLNEYFRYYHDSRTHLALCKDAPQPRAVQSNKSEPIIQIPEVGGLHHRYERRAA